VDRLKMGVNAGNKFGDTLLISLLRLACVAEILGK
jgi:hypothetical protein